LMGWLAGACGGLPQRERKQMSSREHCGCLNYFCGAPAIVPLLKLLFGRGFQPGGSTSAGHIESTRISSRGI
jgi:hypothetical protein